MVAAALIFLVALAACLRWPETGIRWVLLIVIVLAPLRGGLLAVADHLPVGDPEIFVNGIAPALIAAAALFTILRRRPSLWDLPPILVYGWLALALACALDLITQTVGLKLYGIGLVQYLIYPTFAILAWLEVRDRRDIEIVSFVVIGLGLLVSLTVFIQAARITDFVQAAPAFIKDFPAYRFGGITGSYLHTSTFLGVTAVFALGLCLRKGRNWTILSAVTLATMLGAQLLTYSRTGIAIGVIGAVILFALSPGRRLRLVAIAVPAVAAGILIGTLGGLSPDTAGGRVSSGFVAPVQDEGNHQRFHSMKVAVEHYADEPLSEQILGEGIAGTGNARKLISDKPRAVESYYLKVLIETGLVGALLIFPFLVWAAVLFARLAISGRRRNLARVIGAAGAGLSLHLIIYPTLEVQLLAMTWWLLLAMALRFEDRWRA